jgi:hypothetical protein
MNATEIIVSSDGVFSFSLRERNWYWFLDINREPFIRISNICDTCSTIFDFVKKSDLPLAPTQLRDILNKGFSSIPNDVIEMVKFLLPKGVYTVGLINLNPHKPNEYHSRFFREDFFIEKGFLMSNCQDFETDEIPEWHYEILVPIIHENSVDPNQIEHYKQIFQSGEKPIALSLSIDDIRYPSGKGIEHVLAHIILDGHHKILAACELGLPITVLSFLFRGKEDKPYKIEKEVTEYYNGKSLEFQSKQTNNY